MPSKYRRILITAISSGILFFSPLIQGLVSGLLSFAAPLLIMLGVIALLYISMGRGFLFLRLDTDVYRSTLVGAIFLIILFEPFLIIRASMTVTLGTLALYQLAHILLFAIIIQSLIFNLNMKSLVKANRLSSFVPFIGLFLLISMTYSTLSYSIAAGAQGLASLALQIVTDVILLVLLAVIYIKTRLNNLTGMIFFMLYSASVFVTIFSKVDTFVVTFWNFIVLGVMFVIVELVTRDNAYSRKILGGLTGRRRSMKKSSNLAEYVTAAAVISILVFVLGVFPLIMGTVHPIYADPTGSMYPIIKPDSVLIVRGVNVQDIHVRDIIVFTAPWEKALTVAHQVIGTMQQNGTLYFITKGIANPVKDPKPVPSWDVHGIVVYIIPYLGYFFIYLYAILPLLMVPMIVKIR